jgi:hypothetical protein
VTHFPREVTSVDDLVEPSLGLRGDDVVQTSPDALPVHRWDGPKPVATSARCRCCQDSAPTSVSQGSVSFEASGGVVDVSI